MPDIAKVRLKIRKSRHRRVRKSLSGNGERPRLCVRRSLNHIYAQMVDDISGRSLMQVSSQNSEFKEIAKGKTKIEISREVGKKIGSIAKDQGISQCVFDRGGYLFHGRVKALADSAREAGLKF
ncbi:50S ribosomal protein L18 [Fibrobacterota bacterium]